MPTTGPELLKAYSTPDPVKPKPPSPKPIISGSVNTDTIVERARKYVDKMPPAVSGAGGSGQALAVARVLLHDFALERSIAKQLFEAYSARCVPPWSDKEIEHKLDDAEIKSWTGDCQTARGHLVADISGPRTHYRVGVKQPTNGSKTTTVNNAIDGRIDINMLLDFVPEDDKESILGKRWLCEGSTMVLAGMSGIGKSTISLQMAVTWLKGEPFFGIKPRGELKILFIQAENNNGDLAEMLQGTVRGMGLDKHSHALRHTLGERLVVFRESSKTSGQFIDYAGDLLQAHKPDLVFADPLLAYLGGDINKQDVCAKFLRNGLLPIIQDNKCAWIWCHHTGKPPKDKKAMEAWTDSDCSYMGIGSSDVVNCARATGGLLELTGEEGGDRVFKLALHKRGTRAGLIGLSGEPTTGVYLRYARHGGLCWEQCEYEKPEKTRYVNPLKKKESAMHFEEILEKLKIPTRYVGVVKIIAEVIGCAESTAKCKHFPMIKDKLKTIPAANGEPAKYKYEPEA